MIGEIARGDLSRTISFYAKQTLRTTALCYQDFESWPPSGTRLESPGKVPYEDVTITGIEDSLRPDACEAIATCHRASVAIKTGAGDNAFAARSIVIQHGVVTEGPSFCILNPRKRLQVVPHLQVLARSSPEDKTILVETLRPHFSDRTPPLERIFIKLKIMSPEELLPADTPGAAEWNDAITKVRDNLSLFSRLRGGRVDTSPFVIKSRKLRIPKQDRIAL